jgi:hypothetical protein
VQLSDMVLCVKPHFGGYEWDCFLSLVFCMSIGIIICDNLSSNLLSLNVVFISVR